MKRLNARQIEIMHEIIHVLNQIDVPELKFKSPRCVDITAVKAWAQQIHHPNTPEFQASTVLLQLINQLNPQISRAFEPVQNLSDRNLTTDVYVRAHYRGIGLVKEHFRTRRNDTDTDNYSTKPNLNPYTATIGTIPHKKRKTKTNDTTPTDDLPSNQSN